MQGKDEKGPAVKFPPPVALVTFALLAGLSEYCWPQPLAESLGRAGVFSRLEFSY